MTTPENRPAGYHLRPITQGVFGEVSKIFEEVQELEDAQAQGVQIMVLNELSDIIGAVQGFLEKHCAGTTMGDLLRMSEVTRRAFLSGHRAPKREVVEPAPAPAPPPSEVQPKAESLLQRYNISGLCHDLRLAQWAIIAYHNAGYVCENVPWIVSEEVAGLTRPPGLTGSDFVLTNRNNLIASGEQGFLELMLTDRLGKGRYQTFTPCFRDDAPDFWHFSQFMKLELIDVIEAGVEVPTDHVEVHIPAAHRIVQVLPMAEYALSCHRSFLQINVNLRRSAANLPFSSPFSSNLAAGDSLFRLRNTTDEADIPLTMMGSETYDLEFLDTSKDSKTEAVELGSYGVRQLLRTDPNTKKLRRYTWIYGTGLASPRFEICSARAIVSINGTHQY